MKTKATVATLSLLAAVITLFSVGCSQDANLQDEKSQALLVSSGDVGTDKEEKVYWNGTIEEDFDGSSILLVMDIKTGGINSLPK